MAVFSPSRIIIQIFFGFVKDSSLFDETMHFGVIHEVVVMKLWSDQNNGYS